MGPNGSVLIGDDDIIIEELVVMDNGTVVLSLSFSNLSTSQAGQYTCQSMVPNPFHVETEAQVISIQGMSVLRDTHNA